MIDPDENGEKTKSAEYNAENNDPTVSGGNAPTEQMIEDQDDVGEDMVENEDIDNETSVPDNIREYGPLFNKSGEEGSTDDSAEEIWVLEAAFVDVFISKTDIMGSQE